MPTAVNAVPVGVGELPKASSYLLGAQGLRVYRLIANFTTNQVTIVQGQQQFVPASGRTLIYDPTGAEIQAGLEIAFESLDADQYVQIYPGVTYNFQNNQFSKLFLRSQVLYAATAVQTGGYFLGRLVVHNSLVANLLGSSPANAIYTRPAPNYLIMGTATNGVAGSVNWSAVGGGSGIFSYELALPAPIGPGYRYWIKNLGATTVYVAQDGTYTTPATNVSNTFPIAPGQEKMFTYGVLQNNSENTGAAIPPTIYVYSGDANASIAYHVEVMQ